MKFTFIAAQGFALAAETRKGFIGMVRHINMGGVGILSFSSELFNLYLTCAFSFRFVYRNTCILAVKILDSTTFLIFHLFFCFEKCRLKECFQMHFVLWKCLIQKVRWLLMTLFPVSNVGSVKGGKSCFWVRERNSKYMDLVALPKQMHFSSSPLSITVEPLVCLSSASPFSSSLTALLALTNLMDLDYLNVTPPAVFFTLMRSLQPEEGCSRRQM